MYVLSWPSYVFNIFGLHIMAIFPIELDHMDSVTIRSSHVRYGYSHSMIATEK